MNIMSDNYYDSIALGYDDLHKSEQLKKLDIIKSLNIIKSTDFLLDVGCGTAFSLDYFDVINAVGIDPSQKLLEMYSGMKKVVCASAENIPFEDGYFDIVISVTAIQNFTDVEKGLNEIKRVGKRRFVLTVLKKSNKIVEISSLINKLFSVSKFIEEEKDLIFIIGL